MNDETIGNIIGVALIALVLAFNMWIGVLIAKYKGLPASTGASYGIIGVIGWLLLALQSPPNSDFSNLRTCPFCAEAIKKCSLVCRYCKNSVLGVALGHRTGCSHMTTSMASASLSASGWS